MAMPKRFLNVKHNIVKSIISYRLLSVVDRRISVCNFSFKAKSNLTDPENIDGEDFFGIPQNFKLRHARHDKTNASNDNAKPEPTHKDIMYSKDFVNTRQSRSERRKVNHTLFETTFGTISFDSAMVNSSNTNDLASKAQEILTKLSTGNNHGTLSKDKLAKDQNFVDDKRNHESASLKTISQTVNSLGDSHTAKSNYFDEVYYPEYSGQGQISTSDEGTEQNIGRQDNSSVKYFKSVDPKLLPSLSTENISVKSNIANSTSDNQPSSEHSTNIFDEQYFSGHISDTSKQFKQDNSHNIRDSLTRTSVELDSPVRNEHQKENQVKSHLNNAELNEVDYQYFGDTLQNLHSNNGSDINTSVNSRRDTVISLPDIAKNYMNHSNINIAKTDSFVIKTRDTKNTKKKLKSAKHEVITNAEKFQLNKTSEEALSGNITENFLDERREVNETYKKQEQNENVPVITSEDFLKTKRKMRTPDLPKSGKPQTAYELALNIRQEIRKGTNFDCKSENRDTISNKATDEEKRTVSGIKLDSKGFRLLDEQVPDLDKMTSADMVRMLKSKIIFDHEDFLAIDKPYGLPCISQAQDRLSVTSLLPSLAAQLPDSYKASNLHLVQNLDRDVTGAIILAKNSEVAYLLRGLYKDSEMVTQRFWAITKGVPNPPAGIVDIPVGEAKVGNIYKMVLRPRFLKDEKPIGKASKAPSERAITEYKTLSSHLQAALVECTLLTNVKHQIRLHLASGLGTPILGDHKYSNFSKLAPQKLHREMLELIKIRQSKVRSLALHLHCRSIILKNYKGRMIFLTTNPPSHFKDNMHSLYLRRPK